MVVAPAVGSRARGVRARVRRRLPAVGNGAPPPHRQLPRGDTLDVGHRAPRRAGCPRAGGRIGTARLPAGAPPGLSRAVHGRPAAHPGTAPRNPRRLRGAQRPAAAQGFRRGVRPCERQARGARANIEARALRAVAGRAGGGRHRRGAAEHGPHPLRRGRPAGARAGAHGRAGGGMALEPAGVPRRGRRDHGSQHRPAGAHHALDEAGLVARARPRAGAGRPRTGAHVAARQPRLLSARGERDREDAPRPRAARRARRDPDRGQDGRGVDARQARARAGRAGARSSSAPRAISTCASR